MSWLETIKAAYVCQSKQIPLDEITIFNAKTGSVVETTQTGECPVSMYQKLIKGGAGTFATIGDDKYMVVKVDEGGLLRVKGKENFMVIDRKPGTTGDNTEYIVTRKKGGAGGEMVIGMNSFTSYCQNQGYN